MIHQVHKPFRSSAFIAISGIIFDDFIEKCESEFGSDHSFICSDCQKKYLSRVFDLKDLNVSGHGCGVRGCGNMNDSIMIITAKTI